MGRCVGAPSPSQLHDGIYISPLHSVPPSGLIAPRVLPLVTPGTILVSAYTFAPPQRSHDLQQKQLAWSLSADDTEHVDVGFTPTPIPWLEETLLSHPGQN